MRGKLVVGLSGGVDSAAAAYLLLREGYEVIGVTVRTWESGESRCCRIDAARETAEYLGIPYHVISCVSEFRRKVENPFVQSYLHGLTPNPCVLCNPEIKWEWMLYASRLFGASHIATGHYAGVVRKENGRYAVRKGADKEKDQSYMLYRLTQEQLAATVFPLENREKEEIREIARVAGLPSAEEPESQEICFVNEGNYAEYIAARAPEQTAEGNIVDEEGRVLGRHRGIIRYTVGQRRGLGLSPGYPVYVKSIRPFENEIVAAEEKSLMRSEFICGDVCFSGIYGLSEGERMRAEIRIRSRHRGTEGWIAGEENGKIRVMTNTPVRAPAPGQSAVFYDADGCVAGGGLILPEE